MVLSWNERVAGKYTYLDPHRKGHTQAVSIIRLLYYASGATRIIFQGPFSPDATIPHGGYNVIPVDPASPNGRPERLMLNFNGQARLPLRKVYLLPHFNPNDPDDVMAWMHSGPGPVTIIPMALSSTPTGLTPP